MEMDLLIEAIAEKELVDFFDVYQMIDVHLPVDEIIASLISQLQLFFGNRLCQSPINFTSNTDCVNVIPYETFLRNHINPMTCPDFDDFYVNHSNYIELITDEKLTNLVTPYRVSNEGQARIIWLAKFEELVNLVESHPDTMANAVNDILGLGFSKNYALKDELLLYLIFPSAFNQTNYKPTFIEGCMFSYPNSYFLNSKPVEEGWGKTRSTDKGKYEALEAVSPAIDEITDDFKLDAFGYCSEKIDLSNMLAQAENRLNTCR